MGQCFSNRGWEQWPPTQGPHPLPLKGGARASVSIGGPSPSTPPGHRSASLPQGCWRAAALISFEPLIHTGLLNKASRSSRPRPHPTLSTCPSIPAPTQASLWGSLNISLPEVAAVRQFVGLTGGALHDVVGDAKGHSLHLRAQGAPGADLVRQAGDLGPQLGGGSPERPGQPPLAQSARLCAAGDGSLRLGCARGGWGRELGEGQGGPGERSTRAGGAVGARPAG